jgi:hypothetical protein
MANLKVFVSSTCYDLGIAREQLRSFIMRQGFDPVLSEYSDVLYDPRMHTHTSCIQEVPNADMLVLLIGSRFGGEAVPEALSVVDLESLVASSFDVTVLENPEKLSITQLEVLKAIDSSVPVFAFVEEKVHHDHLVYQKNKNMVDSITFPSIEKKESAKYIFEFINFLSHRPYGNSVISFKKLEDIESHLRKQWSALFQKLLNEQRDYAKENRKLFSLNEQIEGLKTAILSTIGNSNSRDIARGVIKFRHLSDFLSGLNYHDPNFFITTQITFESLLKEVGIVEVVEIPDSRNPMSRSALIKADRTFYELRYSIDYLQKLGLDWNSFINYNNDNRKIIFEELVDLRNLGPKILRYRNQVFEEYFKEFLRKDIKVNTLYDVLNKFANNSESEQ